MGALVTAIVFTIGKHTIGVDLGRMSVGSMDGAADSFVVVLAWVYPSALVGFSGPELTKIHARRHGRGRGPQQHAAPRSPRDAGVA